MKECKRCSVEKNLNDFSQRKKNKDGLHSWCKECVCLYNKNFYANNIEKCKQKNKDWRDNNVERNKQRNKDWLANNSEYRSDYKKDYRNKNKDVINHYKREKWARDMQCPKFRLKESIRSRYKRVIKQKNTTVRSKEMVGCSIEELKLHIESKFIDGMNWNNYGKWHIDHIKPISSFDLSKEDEVKKCFHYSNLQPLWEIDNLKKGSKFDN